MTLSGGLQQLPDAIAARLNPANVTLNTLRAIRQPPRATTTSSPWATATSILADNVVFATPSYVTADLVQQIDPAARLTSLREIRYVSTATVSLGFSRSEITCDLNGAGFIVPASEGRRITACSWSSTKFSHRAPDDFVLLRVFIGGASRRRPRRAGRGRAHRPRPRRTARDHGHHRNAGARQGLSLAQSQPAIQLGHGALHR